MRFHLLQVHPLFGVGDQNVLNEVLSIVTQRVKLFRTLRTLLQVQVGDVAVSRILILTSKRSLAR